jgi:hypothetical protein
VADSWVRASERGRETEEKTHLRVPAHAYAHRPRALLDIRHQIEERHLDVRRVFAHCHVRQLTLLPFHTAHDSQIWLLTLISILNPTKSPPARYSPPAYPHYSAVSESSRAQRGWGQAARRAWWGCTPPRPCMRMRRRRPNRWRRLLGRGLGRLLWRPGREGGRGGRGVGGGGPWRAWKVCRRERWSTDENYSNWRGDGVVRCDVAELVPMPINNSTACV